MTRLPTWFVLLLLPFSSSAAAERVEIPSAVAQVLESRHPRSASDLRLLESHIRAIVEHITPATVGIEVGQSIGSGVIIDASGLVLTAAHVIGQSNLPSTVVLPDGRRLKGRTLGASFEVDAGMVQIIQPPDDLPFVPIAESSRPEIGAWVVATGHPGGFFEDRSPPVRLGRVLAGEEGWICTDCTLVGGDSGGPLFDMHGAVTAIHTSIGPSIVHNFHVPVSLFRQDWQRLLEGEVWGGDADGDEHPAGRPVLGISGRTVDNHCLVTQVFPRLPAARAGVLVGDRILSVDGQQVNSFDQVARRVRAKLPGETMTLTIDRNGASIVLEVALSAIRAPLPDAAPSAQDDQ